MCVVYSALHHNEYNAMQHNGNDSLYQHDYSAMQLSEVQVHVEDARVD